MLLVLSALLHAETVTITPAADTTLFQTYPDNNLGATPTLIAGTTFNGWSNRAVMKFDIASNLPPGAVVLSVSLQLTVTRAMDLVPREFRLHRLKQDWGEGAGVEGNIGRLALDQEATWFARFYPDQLWSEPGGSATNDYVAEASAAQSIGDVGSYEFTSTNLIGDVEFWHTNEAANFGWILICSDETVAPSARRFGSREDAIDAPQLIITYALPERSTLVLYPSADTALFEHFPTNNLGAADLAAGTIAMDLDRTRSLLAFDLTDLREDAVVLGAQLNLTVTRTGSGSPGNFELHRLLKPWGEGEGPPLTGHPAQPGEATWQMRFHPDVPWEIPGGAPGVDFVPEPSAVRRLEDFLHLQFTNVVDDVILWRANPGTNFGWILISDAEDVAASARRFASRESLADWPSLVIEYVLQIRIRDLALSKRTLSFTFDALAFNQYRIECRDGLSAGAWQVCTNLPRFQQSGPVTVSFPSTDAARFYRVVLQP